MSAPAIVFVVCAVACVVAHIAILASTIRGRAQQPADSPAPRAGAVLEAIWALLPVIALAIVFTATWARVRERDRAPAPIEIMKVAR